MLQVKSAFQWHPGIEHPSIFRMPNHSVTDQRRGIKFDRPEGYYADTVFGRQQIHCGSWVLTCGSGNVYVVRQEDYWPGLGVQNVIVQKIKGFFRW